MQITIFGATGPTGRELIKQGLEQGHTLIAFARNPASVTIAHERLHVLRGDVYDPQSVEQALAGSEAVISVLGSAYTFKPVDIYSAGTANIVRAMQKQGLRRLLCTSSGGTNPGYDPREGVFFGLILKRTLGRTLYADMRRMEQAVIASDLDWTIVRPAQLIETPVVTPYRTGPGYMLDHGSKTSRQDLANFMLREAQKNEYVRQGVAIATDGQ